MSSIGNLSTTADDKFYVWIALACAIIAVGGFSLTYLGPVATGTFNGPALLHLHGVLSFGWMLLFIVQSALISSQRTGQHRTAGLFGIALATAMIFTVISAGLDGMQLGFAAGYAYDARAIFYVTFSQITLFALMVCGAIAYHRQPEYHKRFMVLATIALLPPATARVLFFYFVPPELGNRPGLWLVQPAPNTVDFTVAAALLGNMLMIPAFVHDWRTRGKPHVVYVLGGGFMLLVNILRGPASRTDLWHAVAGTLAAWSA